jgi:hypothetical protein
MGSDDDLCVDPESLQVISDKRGRGARSSIVESLDATKIGRKIRDE